eukprot:2778249-Lingulodinium_polyedra.AAC.1
MSPPSLLLLFRAARRVRAWPAGQRGRCCGRKSFQPCVAVNALIVMRSAVAPAQPRTVASQ